MDHEKIERINALAKLSRERMLTPEEKSEQEVLRKEYLDGFRANLKDILENVRVQRPDGTVETLRKKGE